MISLLDATLVMADFQTIDECFNYAITTVTHNMPRACLNTDEY